MKVIYFGAIHSSDSDFPLLKEYSRKGIDWLAYVSLTKYVHKAGLFNIENLIPKTGLLKHLFLRKWHLMQTISI